MTKPIESDRARMKYAKVLFDAATAAYPGWGEVRRACLKISRGDLWYQIREAALYNRPGHKISKMRDLLELPKLKNDKVLARRLDAIAVSEGLPGPDFAELSKEWKDEVAPYLANVDDDNVEWHGPIVMVRDFCIAGARGDERRGLPASKVQIAVTEAFAIASEILIADGTKPPGANNTKFVLRGIDVGDARDASKIRTLKHVNLSVASTDNHSVFRTDPFFHRENARASSDPMLPIALKTLTSAQLRANRLRLGSLEPAQNRIPYQLTVFYTIVLKDSHVLLMRRNKTHVSYYPGTVEPSGGEQLDVLDFQSTRGHSAFERWVRRAVVEEFLPTKGVDAALVKGPAEAIFDGNSEIYLQAIGYNTLDGSFPIFALVRLNLDIDGYLRVCRDLATKHHLRPRWENEGRRGWASRDAIVQGLAANKIRFTRMNGIDDPREEDVFTLTRRDVHPMTLARLFLLWKTHHEWWQ